LNVFEEEMMKVKKSFAISTSLKILDGSESRFTQELGQKKERLHLKKSSFSQYNGLSSSQLSRSVKLSLSKSGKKKPQKFLGTLPTSSSHILTGRNGVGLIDYRSGDYSTFYDSDGYFGDVALAADGRLFGFSGGTSNDNLSTIDSKTGRASLIGNMGVDMLSIVFSTNNTMYGISRGANLYTVNPTNAQITYVTSLTPSFALGSGGDVVFDSSTNRFLIAASGGSGSYNLSSFGFDGRVTRIGSIGFDNVFGLTLSQGTLLGYTGDGEEILINRSNGQGTPSRYIPELDGQFNGAESGTFPVSTLFPAARVAPKRVFNSVRDFGSVQLLRGNAGLISTQNQLRNAAQGNYDTKIGDKDVSSLLKDINILDFEPPFNLRDSDCKAFKLDCRTDEDRKVSFSKYVDLKLKVVEQLKISNQVDSTSFNKELNRYQSQMTRDSKYGGSQIANSFNADFRRFSRDGRDPGKEPDFFEKLGRSFNAASAQTIDDLGEFGQAQWKTFTKTFPKLIGILSKSNKLSKIAKKFLGLSQATVTIYKGNELLNSFKELTGSKMTDALKSFDGVKVIDLVARFSQEALEWLDSSNKDFKRTGSGLNFYNSLRDIQDIGKVFKNPKIKNQLGAIDQFYFGAKALSKALEITVTALDDIDSTEAAVIENVVDKLDLINTVVSDALDFSYKQGLRREYANAKYTYEKNQIIISGFSGFTDRYSESVGRYLISSRGDVVYQLPDGTVGIGVDAIVDPPST
jgi:hypothetical protein